MTTQKTRNHAMSCKMKTEKCGFAALLVVFARPRLVGERTNHTECFGEAKSEPPHFLVTRKGQERGLFSEAVRSVEKRLHFTLQKTFPTYSPTTSFSFFFLVCAKTSNERESPIKKEEKKKRKIVPKPVRTQRSSRRIHKTQRGTPFFVLWTQTPPTFCSIDD